MSRSLGALSGRTLNDLLSSKGVRLRTGPYVYRVQSSLPVIAEGLQTLYGDHELADDDELVDFDIQMNFPSLWRRLVRPKVLFTFDHTQPFAPLSPDQAYAFFEWGMNWCVAQYTNRFLKLHASVLEKAGRAVIMPGNPGAGKSTLCAAMMLSGWRLLSDEFALLSRDDLSLHGLGRPIGLKNESIDIIQARFPEAILGPASRGTHKGTVAHLKPTLDSVSRLSESAQPALMVFPQYREGSAFQLTEHLRESAFITAAQQSFNYSILGQEGFDLMGKLIGQCDCYGLRYSDLDVAIAALDKLVEGADV